MTATALTAAQAGLISCETCRLLLRPADTAEPGYCPRCGAELMWRRHHSIQYTWALVVAAAICYIPANVLPMLTTTALGSADSDTIMGGVMLLYTTGSWPLALIVLIASVMVPFGKLVALTYLLITVQRGSLARAVSGAGSIAWSSSSAAGRCSTCSSPHSPLPSCSSSR
jgi:paraquat-inducible protein A